MLAQLNLQPTTKQLRQFGVIAVVAFGVLGGVVQWKGGLFGFDFGESKKTVVYAFWLAGGLSGLFSFVWPAANRPLFTTLSLVAFPIGWIVSHVVLAFLFFGILTPLALFFRLMGRDPLTRSWEPHQRSYWVDMPPPPNNRDYFRQF